MKRSRFSDAQIVTAIKQVELGVPIPELCRKYGISQQTFYRWRSKYRRAGPKRAATAQGAGAGERPTQEAGSRSEPGQADSPGCAGKKSLRPARKRQLVRRTRQRYKIGTRRAYGLMQLQRSSFYYRHRKDPQEALRLRIRDLAAARPRYGYRRLHVLLCREGWKINAKRVLRLYQQESLQVRTRPRRRKVAARPRAHLPAPEAPNERWSLDFVSDELANGRRFRVLTVIDIHSRECLALEADVSLPSRRVTEVLEKVVGQRGAPLALTLDNGTEFTSKHFDAWAYTAGIQLDFISPGRPVETGYIESFNGKLRDECLGVSWFLSLSEAQEQLQAWRRDYNEMRPHSSLGNLPPAVYVQQLQQVAEG